MKVLVIKTTPLACEGITMVIKNLYEAMDKADIQLDILTIEGSDKEFVKIFKKDCTKIFLLKKAKFSFFLYMFNMIKIVRKEKYDIVHIHGNSHTIAIELFLTMFAGCKTRIAHAHSTSCKYVSLNKILGPLFFACCTHGLACGEKAGRFMFGDKPFKIVNNGIDTKKYMFTKVERDLLRRDLKIEEKKVLVHVGGFTEAKNQSFLIDVMSELLKRDDKYYLILVGEGAYKDSVLEKAKTNNILENILFVGQTTFVEQYLSCADIFVMPSVYEGLPLSLMEAQANGLSCFVSERITKEADKTGNVEFLPIDKGINIWVDELEKFKGDVKREEQSIEAIEKICRNGYSIYNEAENLKKYYYKILRKEKK